MRSSRRKVLPQGAGTKPALSTSVEDSESVSLARLRGLTEYEPSEYTFTAWAGTPISEVQSALQHNGQYLPFDPMLVEAGATLGGTVAANANGPGRLRFGGIRDFLIGVRFVDGAGTVLRGGGKVVKNAAGFDFPKLMTGSLGRLGILAELSFKVFPAPAARITAEITCRSLEDSLERLTFITGKSWEVEALELLPPNRLIFRLMGAPEALPTRMEAALRQIDRPAAVIPPNAAEAFWREQRNLSWVPEGVLLVRIPTTPRRLSALDAGLGTVPRLYSMAGNAAWIAWSDSATALISILRSQNLTGLVWRGSPQIRLGCTAEGASEAAVQRALDPTGRFLSLSPA